MALGAPVRSAAPTSGSASAAAMVADPGKLLDAGWKPTVDTAAGLAALIRTAEPR